MCVSEITHWEKNRYSYHHHKTNKQKSPIITHTCIQYYSQTTLFFYSLSRSPNLISPRLFSCLIWLPSYSRRPTPLHSSKPRVHVTPLNLAVILPFLLPRGMTYSLVCMFIALYSDMWCSTYGQRCHFLCVCLQAWLSCWTLKLSKESLYLTHHCNINA